MAQHDLVIDNGPGLAVRTDINAALGAIATNYSGPTEPPTKYPGMFWLDTSAGGNGVLKFRDLANAAWVDPPTGGQFVPKAGGTMTGDLVIDKASPSIYLEKNAVNEVCGLFGRLNATLRWAVITATGAPESGANAGSDFAIARYNDAGTYVDYPLFIERKTGAATFVGQVNGTQFVCSGGAYLAANSGYTTLSVNGDTNVMQYDKVNGRFNFIVNNTLYNTIRTDGFYTVPGTSCGFFMSGLGASFQSNPTTTLTYYNTNAYTEYTKANGNWTFIINGLFQYQTVTGSTFQVGYNAHKPGGGSWTATSDARIKNVLGDYDNGLAAILALHPVRYSYKGNDTREDPALAQDGIEAQEATEDSEAVQGVPPVIVQSPHVGVLDREYIGLIAQEAEIPMPEIVTQREAWIDGVHVTDMRDLDSTPIIFALVNAVKELSARIEALEAVP